MEAVVHRLIEAQIREEISVISYARINIIVIPVKCNMKINIADKCSKEGENVGYETI